MNDKNYKPFTEDTQVLACVDIGFKPGRIPDMFWTCVISCLQPVCVFETQEMYVMHRLTNYFQLISKTCWPALHKI